MAIFGLSLQYSVRGQDDQLAPQRMAAAFERAGEEFRDFGPRVFPKLIPVLEEEVGGQFAAEGRGPNRGGWQDLSPAYAEQKERRYPGQPKLVATGKMRDALTREASPQALRVYSGSQFNFGTQGVEYASFHQTGTGRMPDRPQFDFTPALEDAIRGVASDTAREVIQTSGLDEFGDYDDGGIGREILTGSRGGRYYVSGSGRKVYV